MKSYTFICFVDELLCLRLSLGPFPEQTRLNEIVDDFRRDAQDYGFLEIYLRLERSYERSQGNDSARNTESQIYNHDMILFPGNGSRGNLTDGRRR